MNSYAQPRLNYDILFSVVENTPDPKVATAFMTTCRLLYHGMAKVMLRNLHVWLRLDKQVKGFLLFLHAEDGSRFRHLRRLHFSPQDLSSGTAEEFVQVIPRLIGLEELNLAYGDDTLGMHADLASAFAALTSSFFKFFSFFRSRSSSSCLLSFFLLDDRVLVP